jgi:selenocysteine-specific elongation factor
VDASGSKARVLGHVATANDADDQLWQRVLPAIEATGYLAPSVPELAEQLKLKEPVLKDFFHRKARTGAVMKVTADRYFLRSTLAGLAAAAQAAARAQPDGGFTAAQYRDATGIGRNHVIELLEFFDTLGVTKRFGNVRKMNKDFVPILGAGTAPPRPAAKSPTAAAPQTPRPSRPPLQRHKR